MSTTEPPVRSKSRVRVGHALVVAGAGLLVASFVPGLAPARQYWTTEQALKLQRASANLHQLSHQYDEQRAQGRGEAVLEELERARADYGALSEELESAKRRPLHLAMLFRLLGVTAAIGGGVLLATAARR